jgi:hypothetical protein
MSPPKTKRALLARLLAGPIGIERTAVVHWYRVHMPGDADSARGVVIALVPEYGYILEAYDIDHAHAYVGGKTIALTAAEADAIAQRLKSTFNLRRHPAPIVPRGPSSALDRRRRVR